MRSVGHHVMMSIQKPALHKAVERGGGGGGGAIISICNLEKHTKELEKCDLLPMALITVA